MAVLGVKSSNENYYFLSQQTASKKVSEQRRAKKLLLKGFQTNSKNGEIRYSRIDELINKLSDATEIFLPDENQQEIYFADTGTHAVPPLFKKFLANISLSFIIRPGCIGDLQKFVEWAFQNKANYTIRGAGTWPFGGAVPLNDDILLDISYLDFMNFNPEKETLTIAAGVLFPNARKYLLQHGYALTQEISNAGSGTICGWIATGGIGIGSYKYGSIKNSVQELTVISPTGELEILSPQDKNFENYFGSEGHFGVIAGATIKVRKESYVTKPYAFSFQSTEDAHRFMQLISDSDLKPTSVIYFSESYIKETYKIEKENV